MRTQPRFRVPRHYQSLGFTAALAIVVLVMLVMARDFSPLARTAPLLIGLPTLSLLILQFGRDFYSVLRGDAAIGMTASEEEDLYAQGASSESDDQESDEGRSESSGSTQTAHLGLLGAFAWVAFLAGLIYVVGMLLSIPLFIVAFMRLYGKESLVSIIVVSALTSALVYFFFVYILEIRLYTGAFGIGL